MQVCGVIVTYGDRFHLLSQVINALLKVKIDRIVLVDNGSSAKTQSGLKINFPDLIIHRFEENKGTAIAFKTGIEQALSTDCDLLWLLDDDTCPEPAALDQLKTFWGTIAGTMEKRTALCSYRKDRPNFVDAISNNDPDKILPPTNNFAGFHIKKLFTKIGERMDSSKKMQREGAVPDSGRISAAPYGGLFFHRDLIQKIGLPDELYVLYADDFDYTYRITKCGGEIWLVTSSVLHDLESSFYLPVKKTALYHSALDSSKDASAYYALRNTIHFSKKYLVKNKASYLLNRIIFSIIITVIGILRGKIRRLKVIRSAMRDGEKGKLGFNQYYKI